MNGSVTDRSVNAVDMINATVPTTNTAMSQSSSSFTNAAASQSLGLKTLFKTPEGRYKLHYDKTHPSGLLPYALAKSVTQISLANLKDQPAQAATAVLQPSTSYSVASSGVRCVTSKLLGGGGGGNGSRMLGSVGGNGTSGKATNGGGASKTSSGGNAGGLYKNLSNYDAGQS